MSRYLLIESRDALESRDSTTFLLATAVDLCAAGHGVALFLVQDGAVAARRGVMLPALEAALDAGVEVFVDEHSLRERGIAPDQVAPALAAARISLVIDRLIEGDRVLWH